MAILQGVRDGVRGAVQFLVESTTRLFRPTDDQYPNTGVQPYDGDAYSKWR